MGRSCNTPVTATVSTVGLATSTKQSDGSQKTQIVDGSGNVIEATSNALNVNIKSGSIANTSFAVTQGTAANLKVEATLAATQTLATLTTITNDVGIKDNGNTITVDGTVTANISGSISNTSFASTIADGASVTLGAKADGKSDKTDTTAVTIMSVLKEISYMEQTPASRAVTFTGSNDVATQTTLSAINTKLVSGTDIGDVTINNSTGAAAVNIQDGGNTITVDGAVTNTVLSVVGGGTEAVAQRVTIASDSTGLLSVDDNGGALTVDNGGTFAVQAVGTKTNNNAAPGATNVGTLQGVANAAAPTWTETYLVAESMDLSGNQRVTLGTLISGEDQTNNVMKVEGQFTWARVVADGQIKATAGFVHSISFAPIGTVVAGVISISDATTETTPILYSVSIPVTTFTPFTVILDEKFATGLYVGYDATVTNVQVNVSYR